MQIRPFLFLAVLACAPAALPAAASPWAEVGDNQLRSDIEMLHAAGMLSTITIHWPLPWASVAAQLRGADLSRRSTALRAAAARVLAAADAGTERGTAMSAYADFTNKANVVRGFDGMGRGDGQVQVSLSQNAGAFSMRAAVGVISQDFGSRGNKLMLDGTYLSAQLGDVLVYAGYLDHWWGAGQISALQLSNNARPMPQVGIERGSSAASSWPVLRWLGPWHFEFLLGKMDGPQSQSNVYYNAAHLTISPFPGLEIGAAKTEEFCGQGHPCAPLRDYFQNFDFSTHPNNVNGEGAFDLKYSNVLGAMPFQLYAQAMDEDYSIAANSGTSHLVGLSVWLPTGAEPLKLTAEYTNSYATRTFFSFGDYIYGYTYFDSQYPDGMHYRGRTLGFSLDNDSTLMSLQGSWRDEGGRFYELSLHHATIGDYHVVGANTVSRVPVKLNMAEARVGVPWRDWHLDLAGRVQDGQPFPHSGFAAAVEIALRRDF